MNKEDRYDAIVKYYVDEIWPDLDWRVIKAVIATESAFDASALSCAGCMGLMQISRPLAAERLQHPQMVWCAEVNIELGVRYLKEQADHFPEIPAGGERVNFALASYNCGRGYVNAAIRLARGACDMRHPELPLWQSWGYTGQFLAQARHRGKTADAKQTLAYVDKVIRRWSEYLLAGTNQRRGV